MYCTGGVRCERVSALLRQRGPGFERVYQLAGGVQRYLEASEAGDLPCIGPASRTSGHSSAPRSHSLWAGRLLVFDGRGSVLSSGALPLEGVGGISLPLPELAAAAAGVGVLGNCVVCTAPHDLYCGLRCGFCGVQVLVCPTCRPRFSLLPPENPDSDELGRAHSTTSRRTHAQRRDLLCVKCASLTKASCSSAGALRASE